MPTEFTLDKTKEILTEFNKVKASGAEDYVESFVENCSDFANETDKDVFRNFVGGMNGANLTAEEYSKAIGKATVETQAFNSSVQQVGLKGKIGNILKDIGSLALNIGAAVTIEAIISGAINLIDGYIHRVDDMIAKGEEAQKTIQSINEEVDSHASFVEENGSTYADLRAGVDTSTNANISLTNEEYERYIDLNNQLAEMYPQLVDGFDAQGNALLNLGDSASGATDALSKLVEQEREYAALKTSENIQAAFEGTMGTISRLNTELVANQDIIDRMKDAREALDTEFTDLASAGFLADQTGPGYVMDLYANWEDTFGQEMVQKKIDAFRKTIEELGLTWEQAEVTTGWGTNDAQLHIYDLAGEQLETFIEKYRTNLDELGGLSKDASEEYVDALTMSSTEQREIQASWNSFVPSLLQSMTAYDEYNELDDSLKQAINTAIGNIDPTELLEKGLNNLPDIRPYVREKFLDPFIDIAESDNADLQEAYANLLSLDKDSLSAGEFTAAAREYLKELSTGLLDIYDGDIEKTNNAYMNIASMLGFTDENGQMMKDTIMKDLRDWFDFSEADDQTYLESLPDTLSMDQLVDLHLSMSDESKQKSRETLDAEIENILGTEEFEPIEIKPQTFSSILEKTIGSEEDAKTFSEITDDFQSDINTLQSALDSLRAGEDINTTDLVQQFNNLVGAGDNLEEALSQEKLAVIQKYFKTWADLTSDLNPDVAADMQSFLEGALKEIDLSDIEITNARLFGTTLGDLLSTELSKNESEIVNAYAEAVKNKQARAVEKIGNVDVAHRPVLFDEEGNYNTLLTETFNYSDFGLNKEGAFNVTPILPNGEKIENLEDYIQDILDAGGDIDSSDIFLGAYENIKAAEESAIALHEEQEEMYYDEAQKLAALMELSTEKGWNFITPEQQDAFAAWAEYIDIDRIALEKYKESVSNAISEQNALTDAMAATNSATGLSSEQIDTITKSYKDLEGYDPETLFRKTASGVRLNTKEMEQLNAQIEAQTKSNNLQKIADAEKRLKDAISSGADMGTISGLEDQLSAIRLLAAEYEGATSKFQKLSDALSSANAGDNFRSLSEETNKTLQTLYDEGRTNVDEFRAGANYYSYKDLAGATQTEIEEAWENSAIARDRYFTGTKEGIDNFMHDIMQANDELGQSWIDITEEGKMKFNTGSDEGIAEYFGISIEAVQDILKAASEYNDSIIIGDTAGVSNFKKSLEDLEEQTQKSRQALKDLGEEKVSNILDFDVENLDSIDAVEEKINQLETEKINIINESGSEKSVQAVDDSITALENHKVALSIMTSIEDGASVDELLAMDNETLATTLDIDTSQVEDARSQLQALSEETVDTAVTVKISDEQFSQLAGVDDKEVSVTPVIDETVVDEWEPEDKNADVIYGTNTDEPDKWIPANKSAKVNYRLGSTPTYNPPDITRKLTYKVDVSGSVPARLATGTMLSPAKASGTAYNVLNMRPAYVNGKIALTKDEQALVNELGTESIIRDGKWQIIPGGMHLENLKKGDIVLNAHQTRDLINAGKTFGYGKSYAYGTLSNAYSSGSWVFGNKNDRRDYAAGTASSDVSSNMASAASSSAAVAQNVDQAADTTSGALDQLKEWLSKLMDWIEIRLDRGQKKIDRFISRAELAIKESKFGVAISNYQKALAATVSQITDEQTAAGKYQAKADEILAKAVSTAGSGITQELADEIATRVANGAMEISEYDENVRDVISSYQAWADKAMNARYAIDDLHKSINDYVKSLKEVTDAQRDAAIDKADIYTSVGGEFYANTVSANNGQVQALFNQMNQENAAYRQASKSANSNMKNLQKVARSSINGLYKNATGDYRTALLNAYKAIKSGQKVSDSDLNKIGANNRAVYEQVYAYNLAVDLLEATRLEQAVNYASISAEMGENISDQYSFIEDILDTRADFYENKSKNATNVRHKNMYLDNAVKQYDAMLQSDRSELYKFQSIVAKSAKGITGNRGVLSGLTPNVAATVKKYVDTAKSAVSKGVEIDATTLTKLAEFVSKGYVSAGFYESCVVYNNALQRKNEAETQLYIDEQTIIQNKAALGVEKIQNIQQAYENRRNSYNSSNNRVTFGQDMRTTKGGNLNESDYQAQIDMERRNLEAYIQEANSIRKQNKQNVEQGLYTTASQEYLDMEQAAVAVEKSANDCAISIQEIQNVIDTLNLTRLEEMVDLFDSMIGYLEGLLSMTTASGNYNDASTYRRLVSNSYDKYQNYREQADIDRENWKKAYSDPSGGFGGKSANEWLATMYDDLAAAEQAMTDVYEYQKSLRELPLEELNDVMGNLKSIMDVITSEADLKEAEGHYLHVMDYQRQIGAMENEIAQQEAINAQNRLLYENAVARGAEADAAEYFDAWKSGESALNGMKSTVEGLIDKIRDDFVEAVRRSIDAINDMRAVVESQINIKESEGKYLDAYDYERQVALNTQEYQRQQQVMSDRYSKYTEALIAGNEAEADQMLSEARQAEAAANNLLATNAQLEKSIQNLFRDTIQRELDALDAAQRVIESQMGLIEAQSRDFTEADYNLQISGDMERLTKEQALARENQRLYNLEVSKGNMASAAEYFQAWKSAEAEVNDLRSEIEGLGDAMRKALLTKDLDKMLDKLEQFRESISTISDLINDDMMFEKGHLTEFGMTALAMSIKEYESDTDSLKALLEKRQRYIEEYNNGMNQYYSRNEFDEDMKNITNEIQDMLGNANNARRQIVDIIIQTSKAEIDALSDIIDKRKELLEAQKDYYDFDKSLKSQTNDLTQLQKQKEALDGLTDKESLAKLQKLNKQISEAQEALDETIADHAYELKIDGLDDLKQSISDAYDNYVKELNSNLAAITDAVGSATESVTGALGTVEAAIQRLLDSYGVNGLNTDSVGYTRQYASGTISHPGGPARINENGAEMTVLPDGSIWIPYLPKGTGVITAEMTKNLIDMANGSFGTQLNIPKIGVPAVPAVRNSGNGPIDIGGVEINVLDATNPENIMSVIQKNIRTVAQDVGREFSKNINKIGTKKTWG